MSPTPPEPEAVSYQHVITELELSMHAANSELIMVRARLRSRDQTIADLRRQIGEQKAAADEMQIQLDRWESGHHN